jgi:hypothetical protein
MNPSDFKDKPTLVLAVLLVIFIVGELRIPDNLAQMVNSIYGQLAMVGLVVFLSTKFHPVLTILIALAVMDLLNRATDTSMYSIAQYIPSEAKKVRQMADANHFFPFSLEEQVISQAITLPEHESVETGANYMPILSDTACASASDI